MRILFFYEKQKKNEIFLFEVQINCDNKICGIDIGKTVSLSQTALVLRINTSIGDIHKYKVKDRRCTHLVNTHTTINSSQETFQVFLCQLNTKNKKMEFNVDIGENALNSTRYCPF